jgi:6-phosphogluconolactonase
MDYKIMERSMRLHASKEELEDALLHDIKLVISEDILKLGKAKILLSGGSTPSGLYRKLSSTQLDWSKVIVGLVDERFVKNSSDFSNEKLVKTCFLINEAKNATFIPMIFSADNEVLNLLRTNESYAVFNDASVIILGMGEDGHTASLFPNDSDSNKAMDSEQNIFFTNSPSNPTRRITCTPKLLLSSKNIFLMLTGENKKEVLFSAAKNKLPISHFIGSITEIYYSK